MSYHGGIHDDSVNTYFVSAGTTNLNLVDDNFGQNEAIIRCADIACTILSRETFLANIHDRYDNETTLERVNIMGDQLITQLVLFLNGGNNSVHFDDAIASMVSQHGP